MDAKDIRNLSEAYMEVYASPEELDEGMTMKDFKANRQKNKRKAASADAEKRGHVGKGWYNSGRKYSPDEAKRMRSNLDDEERRTRHRTAVEPDNENDDDFSADKTKNPKKLRKQKAMGEIGEQVDIYDIILSHLLDEGYAETVEAAEVIMVNMSEDWRESIVEAVSGGSYYDLPGVVIRAASGAASKLLNRGQPPAAKPKPHPSDSKLVDVSTADKAAKNLPGSRVYNQRQQQQSR